jgi:hypothetical protein
VLLDLILRLLGVNGSKRMFKQHASRMSTLLDTVTLTLITMKVTGTLGDINGACSGSWEGKLTRKEGKDVTGVMHVDCEEASSVAGSVSFQFRGLVLSHSLSLSLSLSRSLSPPPPPPPPSSPICVCLFVFLSVGLSLSLPLCVCLSVCVSLSLPSSLSLAHPGNQLLQVLTWASTNPARHPPIHCRCSLGHALTLPHTHPFTAGAHLDKKDFFGKSDPFLEIVLARYSFLKRSFHSRMPMDPTLARVKPACV